MADRIGHTDIVAETAEWVAISPQVFYAVTAPVVAAHLSGGKYALRAIYYPPYLKPSEVRALEANGVRTTQECIESQPLVVGIPADGETVPSVPQKLSR